MEVIRVGAVPSSTQDVARQLPVGTVVVAEHQTAGRGRLDRRWEAPPGSALLASWVMPVRELGCPSPPAWQRRTPAATRCA